MFDVLVESLADVPIGAHVSFAANDADGSSNWDSSLLRDLDRIDSDAGPWLLLRLLTLRTPFTKTDGMAPLLAFVRGVANVGNPVHGEIAWGNQRQESVFELATSTRPEQTLPYARQTLRGYSWLTILPRRSASASAASTRCVPAAHSSRSNTSTRAASGARPLRV
ncbi:hypothetical protein ACPPVO_24380 [Dactylosporangium sp. McL0621]|uniref:hypothetical protein n=1 Tax=Dactylosporangium sp. McL0621 TaxID=3415678 RepID=UPI003CF49D4E